MRVVGGKLRGKKLCSFVGADIRPTSDMARESLFNILRFKTESCEFLDLFGGTGAVGIEAYSQGAEKVVITDASKESFSVITENLAAIKNPGEITAVFADALEFLKSNRETFDIIYIDPPYKSDLGILSLKAVLKTGALKEGGVAVLEGETEFSGGIEGLKITDRRKYGRARLTFFARED